MNPTPFVEEINYSEIQLLEVVGKGSFGVVNKGRWRDKFVAVKMISSDAEKKAFLVELRQLSRVDHPNIVKLYGACQTKPVCLVMEYAEGGSLYNVLHGAPQPEYTAAHAISWALQCARGVAYLHGMKPKALIHRDLKPPNLLLINGGTVLKICDFGTACDIQTHMTNNKGSAAWMAPEVFEGSNYSEKCDVFSWGIILWEVITRKKPFDDIRGSAYQILWAVHTGKRPPPIRHCPKPLDYLMNRCWSKMPAERPSMEEVLNVMTHLFVFFKGADQPIKYPLPEEEDGKETDSEDEESCDDSRVVTCGSEIPALPETTSGSDQSTQKDLKGSNDTLAFTARTGTPQPRSRNLSQASAPASLANSKEDVRSDLELTLGNLLLQQGKGPDGTSGRHQQNQKHLPGDLTGTNSSTTSTRPSGHHRSGSYGSNFVVNPSPIHALAQEDRRRKSEDLMGNPRAGLLNNNSRQANNNYDFPNVRLIYPPSIAPQRENERNDKPEPQPHPQHATPSPPPTSGQPPPLDPSRDTIENAHYLLEPHLQPLSPHYALAESVQKYEEHKKKAYDYLIVRTESELLAQRKDELLRLLSPDNNVSFAEQDGNIIMNEYDNLIKERDGLLKLHENLKQQLAMTRSQQQQQQQVGH